MPFIPHGADETARMLEAIGVSGIEELFDEIPQELRCARLSGVPEGLTEMQVARLMHERAAADAGLLCFAGAGAYEHHVPAAVWEITTRGEFYSAYTPYQAEASQGTLQVIYEFQSMICALTGMEIANASMYDGATALAEAVLMAVRCQRDPARRRVLLPEAMHPWYREVVAVMCREQGIDIHTVAFDGARGTTPADALAGQLGPDVAALAIQQPTFFGTLEDVHELTRRAQEAGALVIGCVNPVSLGLLEAPGAWGARGADIACGEGQPLGAPLSSGGPYFGFMATRLAHARQLPGRICGRTVDLDGRPGFTLTLQAREQHIRRSRATSNICTNQGLLATAATIHMAMLGPQGLERVAAACHAGLRRLLDGIARVDGVEPVFAGPHFHEVALRLPVPAAKVLAHMEAGGVLGGVDLSRWYPALGHGLLVAVTEKRSGEDIDRWVSLLAEAVAA